MINWKKELEENVTTGNELKDFFDWDLTNEQAKKLNRIIELYPMSVSKYYLSLIDDESEDDSIKKMCIPSIAETDLSGSMDTSGELSNTVTVGLQHKYKQTALILSTNKCAVYCRHCFRKRLVGISDDEVNKNFDDIIAYIREHKEINNVLISGGDSFLNSNKKIESYLKELVEIDHINLIRFGTRTPVVLPSRIYKDSELLSILQEYSKKKTIYVVTQFNHPREITKEAKKAISALKNIGIIVKNQAVLLKGVNDSPSVMAKLISKLTASGVVPYYVFQCRPVTAVKNQFQIPLKKGYKIVSDARKLLNGQEKCFRYVLSNERGKIEIVGKLEDDKMIFRYHQAKYKEDQEKVFVLDIKDDQCWI